MPAWLRGMLASPPELSPLARYTVANGLFYMGFGGLLYLWPAAIALLGARTPAGEVAGLVRLAGLMLGLVGYFYVMGARTNADSFSLATILDRVVVPVLLLPLALWGGVDPMLVLPFAILDPLMAFGAWWIWSRGRRPDAP